MPADVFALARLDAGDACAERLCAYAAWLAMRSEAATATYAFAYSGAFAALEALRRRALAHGVEARLNGPEYRGRPFVDVIGYGSPGTGSPTTIPLRAFAGDDAATRRAIFAFLDEEWVARAHALTGVAAEYAITSVGELFENALTHAHSDVGVVSCGQFYPKTGKLALSVLDLGIGIPGSLALANGRREEDIDAERALVWALERGHSSLATSRGLGLAVLERFAIGSGGTVCITSGRARLVVDRAGRAVTRLAERFPGTLVDVEVSADRVAASASEEFRS